MSIHNPSAYVTDKNAKEYWSQDGPLGITTQHWSLPRHRSVDHNPLAGTLQSIVYPLNSPPFKAVFLHFRGKDLVWDHVKGLT